MKVVWSKRFARALHREYEYLRSADPMKAVKVRDRIIRAADSLVQFPNRGRAWRLPEARELLIPGLPYALIYRVVEPDVQILCVHHTSRNWGLATLANFRAILASKVPPDVSLVDELLAERRDEAKRE